MRAEFAKEQSKTNQVGSVESHLEDVIIEIQSSCMEGEFETYYQFDEEEIALSVEKKLLEFGYTTSVEKKKSWFDTVYQLNIIWK